MQSLRRYLPNSIKNHDQAFIAFFLAALIIFVFGPVMFLAPILNFDDPALINPLKRVTSFGDYLQLFRAGQILDLQPLRDLTYWIEIQIFRDPARSFHVVNVSLWLGILFIFQRLLFKFTRDRLTSWLSTFYLAIHPVAINSVAWVSGRKHLLSAFFIAALTSVFISRIDKQDRKLESTFLFALLMTCSLLSQPINSLWAFWALAYLFVFHKTELFNKFFMLVPCIVLSAVVIELNRRYYFGSNFIFNSIASKAWSSEDSLALRLAALGRYTFQLIWPTYPSVSGYYPGSWMNLFGLGLLPPLLWLGFKKMPTNKFLLVFLFMILPIGVVTLQLTSVFAMDTYLLTPLLGWAFACGLGLSQLLRGHPSWRQSHFFRAAGAAVILLELVVTLPQAWAWSDPAQLFPRALSTERTPLNLTLLANEFLREGQTESALELGLELYRWELARPQATQVICDSLMKNERLAWTDKYKILTDHPVAIESFKYCQAQMKIQLEDWDFAVFLFTDLVDHYSSSRFQALQIPLESFIHDASFAAHHSSSALAKLLPGKLLSLSSSAGVSK